MDYAADNEFNASQVDPMWHSWLHHIRQLPPHEDKALQQMIPSWMTSPRENITGTRGAFKTYSTTKPKVVSIQLAHSRHTPLHGLATPDRFAVL